MDVESQASVKEQDTISSLRDASVHLPKIEVRFENMCVEAQVHSGQRELPTLVNSTINAIKDFFHMFSFSRAKPFKILDKLNGVIRPSRMTLVLGPPGCGKSTFLQALAGKAESGLKVRGTITYNGKKLDYYIPQRMCAYVGQHDLHQPEMTVRETLEFAEHMLGNTDTFKRMVNLAKEVKTREFESHHLQTGNSHEVKTNKEMDEADKSLTEYIIEKLGLQDCADRIIGDEMRRGISGGEKKRVTIGEMLVGFSRCFFMDNISTGLDSSTAFATVEFLMMITHLLDLTMVISLLQPPQEMFDLFDDIILICGGTIVCHGPREAVLSFFDYMGFKCPESKNTADFLQEVTSMIDQRQYWKQEQQMYSYIPPEKFAESYNYYFPEQLTCSKTESGCFQAENSITTLSKKSYSMSKGRIFKACFSREFLIVQHNMLVHVFKSIQMALFAFVIMTVFLRTKLEGYAVSDGNQFLGAVFVGVSMVQFNGMAELAMTKKRLLIFYKQRKLMFLPSWALLSSVIILSLPMSILETGIWTSLTYYTIGFAPTFTRFLRQFLSFFCVHQTSIGIFRFIAAVGRTEVMTNALGTATLIAIYILGGFVVSKDNIPPWLLWGYWISPMTYGQNAVAVNEFSDDRWSTPVQYENMTYTVGKVILKSRGMFTEESWFWICLGALLGLSIVFNIFSLFALTHLNYPQKRQVNNCTHLEQQLLSFKAFEQRTERPRRTIIPFQPMTLEFQNINYYVDTPTEMRKHGYPEGKLQLLQDVTGAFRPGILTALMGVTGAGKTTLLDVLSGRKTGGYIEGTITISGYRRKQEAVARISAYCQQTDIHSPFITILESLQFSAWLRLPSNLGRCIINEFIDEIMDLLELKHLRTMIVGMPGLHGLSAEQRKRLTIAVELVSGSSIIFMDEPTTGLDAKSASIVMKAVKKTVETGRTVVCTIHQPSIDIFKTFDELLLMKHGGKLIYSGPLGSSAKNMIQYFQAIPGVPKIKAMQNPAVWMLDVTSTTMEVSLGIDYADIYRKSPLFSDNNVLVEELCKIRTSSRELHFSSRLEQSFVSQFMACLWKQNISYWKNSDQNVIRFVSTIVISFLFGTVFWKIGAIDTISTEQNIFNILGVMFAAALFVGFATCNLLLPVMGMERAAFYRERLAGMYSSAAYCFAQVAVEIPYVMVQTIIFSVIVYPMVDFQLSRAKFLWFMLFILLSIILFTIFGMMVAALTPNQEIAALLCFFIFVLWDVFSGFFIPKKMIPVWWRWFYWVDPSAWTIYGLMASQLGDSTQLIKIPGESGQSSIKDFLHNYFGIQEDHLPFALIIHLLFAVFFFCLFFFSTKCLNFQKR